MGADSKIAWTDHTFNPWWGCARVSPGCENCYAEQLATVRRKLPVWGVDAERKPMSAAYWKEPLKWNREAAAEGGRRRVFCASMADVFEIPPERNEPSRAVLRDARRRLWNLIAATPHLDWLLLTKRPENVSAIAPFEDSWPSNIWLGTTAEDQRRYDKRWPVLAKVPAAVHFISHEPALGPLTLYAAHYDRLHCVLPDWVITGGESGSGARPYELGWARSVVAQCRDEGIACFVKQLGAHVRHDGIQMPGEWWPSHVMLEDDRRGGFRAHLRDRKGGDMAEWPADLRVREFPEVRT
jgi:protein gp37